MAVGKDDIFTIEDKYILTKEEKNEAGNELAHKEKQREQIEKDRKERMAAFKSQTDNVNAEIASLSNKVTLGYEYKKFRCTRKFNFTKKVREYYDVETGKKVAERPIEADDYQTKMNL